MRLTLVACLLSLLAATSWAQDAPTEMLATLKIRGGAERAGDSETWGRYTRDDAVIMDADGIARTKAQWMARIKNGSPPPAPTGQLTGETYRVFGDVVIRTGQNGNIRFLAVWVKNGDGVWQVAAAQRTPVSSPLW